MRFVLFLHALGAFIVGFYSLLPFAAAKLAKLEPAGQAGLARGLHVFNRIGQWVLIAQFLTGGYLISHFDMLTTLWIIVVIAVFIALGALAGMMSGPFKRIIQAGQEGKAAEEKDVSRIVAFSRVGAVLVIVIFILMYYPELL